MLISKMSITGFNGLKDYAAVIFPQIPQIYAESPQHLLQNHQENSAQICGICGKQYYLRTTLPWNPGSSEKREGNFEHGVKGLTLYTGTEPLLRRKPNLIAG